MVDVIIRIDLKEKYLEFYYEISLLFDNMNLLIKNEFLYLIN